MVDNFGVVAVLSNNGWLKEEAFFETGYRSTLTTNEHIAARAQGALNEAFDSGTLGRGDQWTHVGFLVCRVTDADGLDLAHEHLQEFVVDTILYIDARGGGTVLPAVHIATNHGAACRGIDIHILINDEKSCTAEFEANALHGITAPA